MATSFAQAQAMAAAAQRANRKLAIHFNQRQVPSILRLRELVAAGALGQVYHVRATWHRRRGIPLRPAFLRREQAWGGAMADNGVHMLDKVLYLLGHPEPRSVSGHTFQPFAQRDAPGLGMDVEDFAVALVRLASGATLTLEISWASHHHADEETLIQLYGREGGALLRARHGHPADFLLLRRDGGRLVNEEIACHDVVPVTVQADLLAAIREDREPIASAAHGLATMRILDAFYASVRAGHDVAVAPD
jgi:predicted dehydrogenase